MPTLGEGFLAHVRQATCLFGDGVLTVLHLAHSTTQLRAALPFDKEVATGLLRLAKGVLHHRLARRLDTAKVQRPSYKLEKARQFGRTIVWLVLLALTPLASALTSSEHTIAFTAYGRPKDYFFHSTAMARMSHPEAIIYLLHTTNSSDFDPLYAANKITIVRVEPTARTQRFLDSYRHSSGNTFEYEQFCIARFFYVRDLLEARHGSNEDTSVIMYDLDTLTFLNFYKRFSPDSDWALGSYMSSWRLATLQQYTDWISDVYGRPAIKIAEFFLTLTGQRVNMSSPGEHVDRVRSWWPSNFNEVPHISDMNLFDSWAATKTHMRRIACSRDSELFCEYRDTKAPVNPLQNATYISAWLGRDLSSSYGTCSDNVSHFLSVFQLDEYSLLPQVPRVYNQESIVSVPVAAIHFQGYCKKLLCHAVFCCVTRPHPRSSCCFSVKCKVAHVELSVAHYKEGEAALDQLVNLVNGNIDASRGRLVGATVYNKGDALNLTRMSNHSGFLRVVKRDNIGREGEAHLSYIIERYFNLPDYVIFTQAKPNFLDEFGGWLRDLLPGRSAAMGLGMVHGGCGCGGCYNAVNTTMPRVREMYALITRSACPGPFISFMNGQFVVHKSRITHHDLSLYRMLYGYVTAPPTHFIHEDVSVEAFPVSVRGKLMQHDTNNPAFGHVLERVWSVIWGCHVQGRANVRHCLFQDAED